MPAPTEVPAAAPAALRRLLTGPRRPATVLAAFGPVAYLEADGEVLAVGHAGALRLPFTVLVTGPRGVPVAATDAVEVGQGEVRVAGGPRYAVRRWWRPREPRPLPAAPDVGHRADELAALLPPLPAPVAGVGLVPGRLVGLGPGLTPAGDDVLAGALATRAASAEPSGRTMQDQLAAHTLELLHRTTSLSGALLRHAAAGRVLPQVVDVLDALGGRGDLVAATGRLLAVGSSSGAALGHGVVAAVRAVRSGEGHGVPTWAEVA